MTKDHVLQEIRRTAEANGGVPLGWRKFTSETGIRNSDWLGKYWARWSDAIREAGLAPNQLTDAYGEADLLDKYARLVSELGRLPATSDLRLKARMDPGFPSDKTFNRFGAKSELVRRLIEHCRKRDEYENVVRLCEEYVPRDRQGTDEVDARSAAYGFVYLIKSGRFYKIGYTNSAGRREREIALQLPEMAAKIHDIRTDDRRGIEEYWHKRFAEKRKNGEWFELDAADVAAFKRRKFM